MSTIFISHSSADNDLARDLAARLQQQGHTCLFLDLDPDKGIVAGESWERTLYRKLRACRAVIALCTDSYLKSYWCFAEIALARMEGKQIIAMLADPLDDAAKLPSILSERQFIDLRRDPEAAYQRLWRGLRELDLLGATGDWDPGKSPYLGLNAYQEQHAPVYFGRESEIRATIELIERGAPGLILILGASGSGKSSLARAGVVPRLKRETDRWIVLDPFRPGREPFYELAQLFAQSFRRHAAVGPHDADALLDRLRSWHDVSRQGRPSIGPHPDEARLGRLISEIEALKRQAPDVRDASLLEFLDWSLDDLRRIVGRTPGLATGRTGATPLIDMADDLRRAAGRPDARVLLVLDQFEELLAGGGPDDQSARFLALLAASLAAEGSPLTVVATMRSDFLEAFQTVNAHHGMDFETLSLGPMPIEGMRRVIEAPAKLGAIELESGLADRLLQDASTPDALPLLSFTLWLLWRDGHASGALTLRDYDALGGVEGAVAGEADAILALARQRDQEAQLRTAFLQMVRLTEDGQIARQPVAWDAPELQPVHDLLDRFIERRLLLSRAESDRRVVEVAHEAIFRTWLPLRRWIEEHRAELQLRQRIRRTSEAWETSHRQSDYLWRGARLSAAVDLLGRGGLDGSSPEDRIAKAFVQASQAMRQQQGRRRRNVVLLVTSALLGLLAYALLNEHVAKRAQRTSWAREQSLAAISTMQTDPMKSIGMAQAAVCLTQSHDGIVLSHAQSALNQAVHAVRKQRTLRGHDRAVSKAMFLQAGDGATETLVSLGQDRRALIWRVPGSTAPACSGVPMPDPLAGPASLLAGDPQSGSIAVASPDGTVMLYHTAAETPEGAEVFSFGNPVAALTIAPGGQRIAAADSTGSVRIAQLSSTGAIASMTLAGQPSRIAAMAFNQDATLLATAGWQGTVNIWDATSGELLHSLSGSPEAVTELTFRGDLLASGGWDKTVRLWNTQSGALLHEFSHDARISALSFVPGDANPAVLASASWDGTVRLWDTATGEMLNLLPHGAPVVSLATRAEARSPLGQPRDGFLIASGDWDGRVQVWNVEQGAGANTSSRIVAQHLGPVNDLGFGGDGQFLASAGDDSEIRISRLFDQTQGYDWQSGLDLGQFNGGTHKAKWIAMISAGSVRVIDTEAHEEERAISDYQGNATAIAFSKDGSQRLAILADELFEYHLDPRELMICADQIAQPGTGAAPEYTLSERCAETGATTSGFSSLWSQAMSIFDGFAQRFSKQ
ncbi:TIR domain-containing protein [Paracoccus litorisediminis]|uniref:TIR domain-containing protein n=1 Tax=Paracoccus litorisediminis TaxID=2006130 RepID=A0A844HL97_9RHOB|nr:TIR domain-containing protein [Paracoccus litorisediminis]MTH61033.1 TIR domain-containing protein [Paracoccus litorisediminis]